MGVGEGMPGFSLSLPFAVTSCRSDTSVFLLARYVLLLAGCSRSRSRWIQGDVVRLVSFAACRLELAGRARRRRDTRWAAAPVEDLGSVDRAARASAGRQAQGIADRTVDSAQFTRNRVPSHPAKIRQALWRWGTLSLVDARTTGAVCRCRSSLFASCSRSSFRSANLDRSAPCSTTATASSPPASPRRPARLSSRRTGHPTPMPTPSEWSTPVLAHYPSGRGPLPGV